MTLAFRTSAAALAALLLLAACSSGSSSGGTPAASFSASAPAASAPAAAASAAPAASAPAAPAAEPCSYLTAQEVGAIVGTTPVEVAERVGRGDCDYWLTAARDAKVNVGVFIGPDGASYFETAKGIGTPEPVNVGDEAYAIFNEGFGTVVVARKGDAVVAVQVFAVAVAADQLRQATALVEAVFAGF